MAYTVLTVSIVVLVVIVVAEGQLYPFGYDGPGDNPPPGYYQNDDPNPLDNGYFNGRGASSGVCHVRSRPACANHQNWCNTCVDECNNNYDCPLGHTCCANPSCGNICEPASFW